jgi:hypothetical protein
MMTYRQRLFDVQVTCRPGQHLSHQSPRLADTDRTGAPPTA